jgi:hypothetical protein
MSKYDARDLEDWESQLDVRESDLDTREADMKEALEDVEEALAGRAVTAEAQRALQEALDWAAEPNAAMPRDVQRLVLRTLLADAAPCASFPTLAQLSLRMLP